MELSEILAALGAYVTAEDGSTDDEKLKTAVKDFRSHDNPQVKAIAQRLLNAGAKLTKTDSEKRIKALETQLEEAQGKVTELEEAAQTAQGQPNEKVTAAERERDKAREKAAKLEADLKAEREGRKSDRVGTKAEKVVGKLRGQVDDDYLDEVLTPRIQKRIRPTDDDVEFLGDDETPYEGDDKARAESLAADLLKVVPDKYRLRQMSPGGGGGRGGQGGTVTVEQLQQEKASSGAYSL